MVTIEPTKNKIRENSKNLTKTRAKGENDLRHYHQKKKKNGEKNTKQNQGTEGHEARQANKSFQEEKGK